MARGSTSSGVCRRSRALNMRLQRLATCGRTWGAPSSLGLSPTVACRSSPWEEPALSPRAGPRTPQHAPSELAPLGAPCFLPRLLFSGPPLSSAHMWRARCRCRVPPTGTLRESPRHPRSSWALGASPHCVAQDLPLEMLFLICRLPCLKLLSGFRLEGSSPNALQVCRPHPHASGLGCAPARRLQEPGSPSQPPVSPSHVGSRSQLHLHWGLAELRTLWSRLRVPGQQLPCVIAMT